MFLTVGLCISGFSFRGDEFVIDGKPVQLRVGEMHPARIPYQYWRHRIQMARAMGMNTVSAYIMWNSIEQKDGSFDFSTPQNNISRFVEICQEEGLYVLLRPGPYVCAEWDFGGIPQRFLNESSVQIRTGQNEAFKNGTRDYITAVSQHVRGMMSYNGGNILMIQIENEYGHSVNRDPDYMDYIRQLYIENDITGPFYTADNLQYYHQSMFHLPGTAIGINGDSVMQAQFDEAAAIDSNVPVFVTETYPGWFKHFNEPGDWRHNNLTQQLQWYMDNNKSFTFYVLHGGTNFGQTAGANGADNTHLPSLTSYDYGSPITESGLVGPFYTEYRDIIQHALGEQLPDVPAPIKQLETDKIALEKISEVADQAVFVDTTQQLRPFEHYGQNQGIGVYTTTLPKLDGATMAFQHLRDIATIYLDGRFIKNISRLQSDPAEVVLDCTDSCVMEIYLETFGHKNDGAGMQSDQKGIFGEVLLNGRPYSGEWTLSLFDLEGNVSVTETGSHGRNGGVYRGYFDVSEPGDTFLDMRGFQRGYAILNGRNLGRYWTTDNNWQKCLFAPGVWLNRGKNELIIIESLGVDTAEVQGHNTCPGTQ